eukprot:jgi/Ulvmu1/2922/UM149_0001.1
MLASCTAIHTQSVSPVRSHRRLCACSAQDAKDPLLLRVARGEDAERTPVWLMRQAGRYMKEFRAYSDKYPFRQRSETPDIAIELSLQPWRAFKTDGVIFFSDILTPLPALGIEFDVIKGKGPVISDPVRSIEQVEAMKLLDDPASSLPFIKDTLSSLRREIDKDTTLLGFVGSPWTLTAYSMEGAAERHCKATKTIMMTQPQVLHKMLNRMTDALITYCKYQIKSGAQIVQIFDSWAHHLSPQQFTAFSMPYAQRVIDEVRREHPTVPLIFHANGGVGKLARMHGCTADVLGIDWNTDIAAARELMPSTVLQGNIDPMVLFGTEDQICQAFNECCEAAGPQRHILNVGHGVVQGTPEDNVKFLVQLARDSSVIAHSS